jgi:dolichyl-phosphate-mannose-protein mannosyltransferase
MNNFLQSLTSLIAKRLIWIYTIIILIFSFLTFFSNYYIPNASIWDEVFHISTAEKYLTGTMVMEAHPPLGKLFIALGEKIINPNTDYNNLNPVAKLCLANTVSVYKETKVENGVTKSVDQRDIIDENTGKTRPITLLDIRKKTGVAIDKQAFTATDSIGSDTNGDSKPDSSFPDYFSFCGYRFFPTLFGSLIPIMFFILILLLTDNKHLALMSSSLLIFDNAILIQSRAAMLDSIQLFFIVTATVWLVKIINSLTRHKYIVSDFADFVNWKNINKLIDYALLGLFIGLASVTKHNSFILLIYPVILAGLEIYTNWSIVKTWSKKAGIFWTNFVIRGLTLLLLGVFAYCFVFYIHSGLGVIINPNSNNNSGNYKASVEYKGIIARKDTWNLANFPTMFIDNWNYMDQYHKGVPKLDYTKSGENGSYPTNWPVMNRTIRYRIDPGSTGNFYFSYLIGNPVIWLFAALGLLLTFSLITSARFFGLKIKDKRTFGFLVLFAGLYGLYMLLMLYTIEVRVMYLYHYFIGLFFSLCLLPLLINYWFKSDLTAEIDWDNINKGFWVYSCLVICLFLIIWGFVFYAPFTYYLPLTEQSFGMRNLFDFWQMRGIGK